MTFATGLLTRLSNQVTRTVTLRARRDVDAGLAADQALRAELVVGQRHARRRPELAVQLVERRRAEAGADSPQTLTRPST